MNSKSIPRPHKTQRNKALEGTVARIWGTKVPRSRTDVFLKDLVLLMSDGLVHLDSEDRTFLHGLKTMENWYEPYCRWSKTVSSQKYVDHANGGEIYFSTAIVASILRKYEGPLVTSIDPLGSAMERFEQAEKICRRTNRRLRHYRQHSFRPLTKRLGVDSIFHRARQKIEKWLGSSPDLNDMADRARHGPGGNLSTGRPFVTPYYKFGNDGNAYKVGRGAHALARMAITTCDTWRRAICCEAYSIDYRDSYDVSFPQHLNWRAVDEKLEIADYNKVTFVPKDAFTMRSIAIEPDMNIYLQLGVGGMIRDALSAAGCNLNSQERNQVLAWLGSIESSWYDPVTVDMSMASDTIAIELVRELLPADWFNLLFRLRSPKGSLNGCEIVWEKFSSMGNGYTFELESLIFYALAQAVQDEQGVTDFFRENGQHAYEYLGVYGDDIIIPQACWPQLHEILKFCGFVVNWDKSFVVGPFRESCGKDWWNGRDVRPLFIREDICREGDLVKVRNGVLDLIIKNSDLFSEVESLKTLLNSSVNKTLFNHLRGVGKGMHSAYLNFPEDQTHVSALVTFDRDLQAFKHPVIHEKAIVYRGRALWRYVQFLYSSSSRKTRDQSSLTDTVIRQKKSCPLLEHVSSGGDPGDVIRSGVVEAKTTYRTM